MQMNSRHFEYLRMIIYWDDFQLVYKFLTGFEAFDKKIKEPFY